MEEQIESDDKANFLTTEFFTTFIRDFRSLAMRLYFRTFFFFVSVLIRIQSRLELVQE